LVSCQALGCLEHPGNGTGILKVMWSGPGCAAKPSLPDGKTKQREIINIASDVWKVPDARFFLPYALAVGVIHDSILAAALGPSGIM